MGRMTTRAAKHIPKAARGVNDQSFDPPRTTHSQRWPVTAAIRSKSLS
jgi:hypothetical protein